MFKSLKGMADVLPAESKKWQVMEAGLRQVLGTYGYEEIRTPFLESAELFTRSIGTATDVVEKEMYSFTDQAGSSIALRPEGTASVIRAYIEQHLGHETSLLKLFYLGPMFRHERPQKGRLRQFSQVGVEAVGSESSAVDADVLILAMDLMRIFGVSEAKMELNSVGDPACRPAYRAKLQDFLRPIASKLCENCRRRVETNPLRVLDCKVDVCAAATAEAPLMINHLCAPCATHFEALKERLTHVLVPFTVNPRIVRGLDYYTRTAFEIVAGGLGSQNAVIAGGRYDGLAEELGGSRTPSVGWAMGLERLLLSARNIAVVEKPRIEIIPLDTASEPATLRIAARVRGLLSERNVSAVIDSGPAQESLKGALRRANKAGSILVVLLGEAERKSGKAMVKSLAGHSQEEVDFEMVPEYIAGRFDGIK